MRCLDQQELAIFIPDACSRTLHMAGDLLEKPHDKPLILDVLPKAEVASEAVCCRARGSCFQAEGILLPYVLLCPACSDLQALRMQQVQLAL